MANKAKLQHIATKDVQIEQGFWAERQTVNREVTLPLEHKLLESTHRINALRLRRQPDLDVTPHEFWESDIAKWIEAAGYSLATHPNAELETCVDRVIDLLADNQQEDGYLNVYFTHLKPEERWTNLRDMHELYCLGHLMEAAVAYFEGTGKRRLLDVMCRAADYLIEVFGDREGQMAGYPGHEEIELALVRLADCTSNREYLELAKFFVDARGTKPHYFSQEADERGDTGRRQRDLEYWQAHVPVRDQYEAVGHAVRAVYLYSGMADVAGRYNDNTLLHACRQLWDNITRKKMYVTGGIGARHAGETFGRDYELPNETAYAETCAAIGLIFFAQRMLAIEADSRYADVIELALYNGALSGVSLDGKHFFYVNPLAADGKWGFNCGSPSRQEWFGCSCCPPNIARLLASLGQYIYSQADREIYIHQYVNSATTLQVDTSPIRIQQTSNYPWNGDILIAVQAEPAVSLTLKLRVPGWCKSACITLNGDPIDAPVENGYATITRCWSPNDKVCLGLDMPIEQLSADPRVLSCSGKVALRRGPMIYCVEQTDQRDPVHSLALSESSSFEAMESDILGGCVVLRGNGISTFASELYIRAPETQMKPVQIQAIPYAFWDNRGTNAMVVWLPKA